MTDVLDRALPDLNPEFAERVFVVAGELREREIAEFGHYCGAVGMTQAIRLVEEEV